MKIAFATTDGKNVDEHFGRAGMFAVYEITEKGHHFVEIRKFADGMDRSVADTRDMGPLHDNAVESKVDRLADCRLIYLTEIGGPSAARLVKRRIMPMKVKEPVSIETALLQLEETIKKTPPPWMRKALNDKAEFGVRSEEFGVRNAE
ncbi:MAG: nitrogen fixation protein NifX [Nitrospirae bacterium GWD2_57_9]|nr:MAG: nitrogen fixation protein NifX [Nitrospirae bacterium GWD2_57_9]